MMLGVSASTWHSERRETPGRKFYTKPDKIPDRRSGDAGQKLPEDTECSMVDRNNVTGGAGVLITRMVARNL